MVDLDRAHADEQVPLPVPSEAPSAQAAPVVVTPRDLSWRTRFERRLVISDLLVLIWVVFGAQIAWFGTGNAELTLAHQVNDSAVSYWVVSILIIAAWMLALTLADSRSYRVVGVGSTEYLRVADASLRLFGAIAIIAFLTQNDIARGFLLISLPAGVIVLIIERWLWRQWLIAKRAQGSFSARVLLVGSAESVAHAAKDLDRNVAAGFHVVGACVPSWLPGETLRDSKVAVVGTVYDIPGAMRATGADTVAVTSTDELPATKVKEISWNLEAGRGHLVLAPNILDVAGPRLHTRAVAGLPLIHVETPRFSRGQRLLKRLFDIVASTILAVLLSPLLLVLALIVRFSSPGPILFRQVRVGFGGTEFKMLKFRSMVVDAEERLAALMAERDAGNEIMFKMRDDPRVTRVGRVMRRFSLDELPQLFNVIGGSMSLVGPRPPLPREVAQYATHVHRRFLVRPGITGLWQVSGRSTLSWEDTVRLDLNYVENWTFMGDLLILARTAKAAVAPGATAA